MADSQSIRTNVTHSGDELHFPYMVFARRAGGETSHPLIFSGMPAPDPELFGPPEPPDLGFASVEALPLLEERLGAYLGVEPERVIVTVGASSAMHVLALCFFRGARVASEVPSYEPLRALPEVFGADVRPLARRPEHGWTIEAADARRALAGAGGPGHVFLTSPHNPSGATLEPERLVALAAEAERAGGILISNEVYLEYLPRSARTSAAQLAPNAVAIGSLTKAYGLGALRVGWIALGEGLAGERGRLEDGAFLGCVEPPTPTLRLALRAVERLDELRRPFERLERESKPILSRWLEETAGIDGEPPAHGLICFPRIVGVDDTAAFRRHLVREHDVDVVPGEFFGAPGYVRLSFGAEPDRLREALARLARGIDSYGLRHGQLG